MSLNKKKCLLFGPFRHIFQSKPSRIKIRPGYSNTYINYSHFMSAITAESYHHASSKSILNFSDLFNVEVWLSQCSFRLKPARRLFHSHRLHNFQLTSLIWTPEVATCPPTFFLKKFAIILSLAWCSAWPPLALLGKHWEPRPSGCSLIRLNSSINRSSPSWTWLWNVWIFSDDWCVNIRFPWTPILYLQTMHTR